MNKSTKQFEKYRKKLKEKLLQESNGLCEFCGRFMGKKYLTLHEIFGGAYRKASVYCNAVALVCPLCNCMALEGSGILTSEEANKKLCVQKGLDYNELMTQVYTCDVKKERLQ